MVLFAPRNTLEYTMAATSEQKTAIPGGDALFYGMQGRLKVLYISTASRAGGWLAEAFAADSAAEILLEEVTGQAAGVERLRDEVFDAILVSHEPGELDAVDLIEGYRRSYDDLARPPRQKSLPGLEF
jgi:hypothetical protein